MTTIDGIRHVMREHDIPARGIVHVGAHKAEELPLYRRCGFARIVLVEPNPQLAAELRGIEGVEVVEAACASAPGRRTLHITEQTRQASLYRPLTRPVIAEVEVDVYRLADLVDDTVNVAVVDAQGAELEVVAGAPLDTLDMVVLETHRRSRYAEAPGYDDVVASMARVGWTVAAQWPHDPKGKLRDVAFVKAAK